MKQKIWKGTAVSLSLVLALSTAFMARGLDGAVVSARANMTYDIETEEEKEEAGNHKGKGDKTKKVEETDYIVTLKNDSCYKKMENSARENDLFSETSLRADAELEENQMMVLKLSEDEASQIEEIGGVEEIEEDLSMTANEVVEPDIELVEEAIEQNKGIDFNQWNLNAINLPQCCFNIDDEESENETDVDDITGVNTTKAAISSKKCHMGKGVKIAILDSGISYGAGTHIKERINFLDNADASSPVFDDVTGHGTGIVGIISADGSQGLLQGIAPGSEIYSLRVLDQENSAPVSRIISGIYWCIENDMDVINMSFGMSRYSSALEKAVNDAKAAGIIMTAAAGNHGDSVSSIDYPAAFDGVIAVGATDGENKLTDFTSKGMVHIYSSY